VKQGVNININMGKMKIPKGKYL